MKTKILHTVKHRKRENRIMDFIWMIPVVLFKMTAHKHNPFSMLIRLQHMFFDQRKNFTKSCIPVMPGGEEEMILLPL
jgi:hypothetical protein